MDNLLNQAGPKERCGLCRKHPKVAALLDRWLDRRLEGDLESVTVKDVWTTARAVHKYPHTTRPLYDHLERCRSEDYAVRFRKRV